MIRRILLTVTLLAAFFLFGFNSPVQAVIKASGDLEVTTDEPLFSSSIIWYPGLSVTKSFIVKNKGVDTHTVLIEATNTSETGDISKIYLFQVAQNGTVLFGGAGSKTLKNFWDAGQISLKDVVHDGEKLYDLSVSLPASTGNEYQSKSAKFDLVIGFEGTEDKVIVSGDSCSDQKPSSDPTSLTAVAGTNSVTLSWTAASDPVTYYLVTYGNFSGAQTYGNPNVGGKGTTSYTVSGLSGGTTYYFKVRAGNGCAPGDYSNEVSATPGGGVVQGPAAGFAEGVLGAQDNINSGTATASPEIVNVLGAQTSWLQKYWWILPLIIFGGLLLWWFLGKMRGNEDH